MKDKQINLRLSTELYNMLQVKSKASNLSASDYIRQSINNSDIKIDNSKDISKLIASLNHIGNNINQISKNLNIANNSNNLSNVDYEDLLNSLIIMQRYLKDISECN